MEIDLFSVGFLQWACTLLGLKCVLRTRSDEFFMSLKTQRLGQIGVNVVERVVLNEWQGRWQALDAQNDDGVDGLIFLESNGEITGQVVYVQIKTFTNVRLSQARDFMLPIGAARLAKAISRWRKLIGAAIIIYVNPKTLEAYWADAKGVAASNTQIAVPSNQRFNKSARKPISRLCGSLHRDLLSTELIAEAQHFNHLVSKDHVQVAARKIYKQLQETSVQFAGNGPMVEFTREGWRHIIRPKRPKLTRYQSFVLLGVLRLIIENSKESDLVDARMDADIGVELLAIKATVSFPFRHTGIVKVVLKKLIKESKASYEFHTVYEPKRRLNLMGIRGPLSQ
jgi:hypothetical protein